MKDSECVQFLQWALPRLRMRWPGFRKVRGQVCKRLHRRLGGLNLDRIETYRAYLESHPQEWAQLDGLCRITISRFYRDKAVFALLEQEVLPKLAGDVLARGEDHLRIWSCGCGAGEEPYTLALLWALALRSDFPGLGLHVLATDADPKMIARAQAACYSFSSLKDLPVAWRETAFTQREEMHCLKPEYRRDVAFRQQDIRAEVPHGPFDLVLCRNLTFTYFDHALQSKVLEKFRRTLTSRGILVIGIHETLPRGAKGFSVCSGRPGIYQANNRAVGNIAD